MRIAPGTLAVCVLAVAGVVLAADLPTERISGGLRANLVGSIDRPLRYTPSGGAFVITNGAEFFNRPLYCDNTACRIDAGDKPELSFYLPGRGGNLRLGFRTAKGLKWLNDADCVIARYVAGSMTYEINDQKLEGCRELHLTVVPLSGSKGVMVRVITVAQTGEIELVWAFGGANGMKGRRSGDIGCEREPVSRMFQLRPEQCAGSHFTIASNSFTLRTKSATLAGVASSGAELRVGDANLWSQPAELLSVFERGESSSAPTTNALVVGRLSLARGVPVFLAIQPLESGSVTLSSGHLAETFAAAEAHRQAVAGRVVVETPDEFVNAAASALNIAADAVWDEQQSAFMHGGVAWRVKLLGWRGQYAGDALGWHDRTRRHLETFVRDQNTSPIPGRIPEPEAGANLARNESALHSNGNLGKNHYDMNLVAMDALLRHLLWTGDREFAERMWPVLERHLAWERRLFRREFGPEKLPLYEGYACIWASDDLAYNGGGAAHSSAYNYYHHRMAARVARWLGKDGSAYEREADLIAQGMRENLWSPREGCFAEWRDYLGAQSVHPSGALWTFYHTLDSEVPSGDEAWRMSRYVDTQFPRIPIQGKGVPAGNFTLPTTTWMPYTWSLNNVVMAESMHTALAYWQAGRGDAANPLFKGALLDSMFLGLCPGNVGMCTAFDAYRGESQRDFADGVGATSRALIEGLFGIKPDAIAGELCIKPGFPNAWDHAAIQHPDVSCRFKRDGLTETYVVESHFPQPPKLRLNVAALCHEVANVTVNGVAADWRKVDEGLRWPRIEITANASAKQEVKVVWQGRAVVAKAVAAGEGRAQAGSVLAASVDWHKLVMSDAKPECVDLAPIFNDSVSQIFRHEYLSPRSPFCSLATPKQGIGSWCHPTDSFEVNDAGLRVSAAKGGGRIFLPNGLPLATPGETAAKNIAFVSQWQNFPKELTVPLQGKSAHAFLLMAGSTTAMQSRFDNGEVVVTYADGTTARLALRNPETWWPIDQDYFIDDFAFRWSGPLPPRVDLKTGKVRVLELESFKGRGGAVPGGAATVLNLPIDPAKELKSLTVRALANEVVIGLMSVTLQR
ncbi:MAG: hypothetical protein RLY20_2998 [Verrucomicrobiota bacterium]